MIGAYLTGLTAGLTPCTVVIYPLFLYRFGVWGDKKSKVLIEEILFTLVGFLLSLVLSGLIFEFLSKSEVFNALRLIIGTLLVVLGVLQLAGKFSVNVFKRITSPFLLGFTLPFVLSFSPCVFPFFTSLLSASLSGGTVLVNILAFGVGLISPALLMAFLGNRILNLAKKGGKLFYYVEKFSGLIVIFSGIYLSLQILEIKSLDIVFASVFFGVFILLAAYYSFWVKRRFNLANFLMFLAVLILWFVFSFHCYTSAVNEVRDFEFQYQYGKSVATSQCSGEPENCPLCQRCALLFGLAALVGSGGFVISERSSKRRV
jgi:cytochrome c biogenesis protein CcdA